jgi:hypothetical protein
VFRPTRRTAVLPLTAAILLGSAGSALAIPIQDDDEPGLPPNKAPSAALTVSPNPVLVSQLLPVNTTFRAIGVQNIINRGAVSFNAAGSSDSDGVIVKYDWDLDGNGSFETPGQTATFSARNLRAPATRTVRVRVTDDGGLTATDAATVDVIWNFTGFFQPVDNPPVLNVLKAGRAVPVRFSLDGFQGLGISAPGHPRSEPVACDATQEDAVEETVPALVSVLLYNPLSDRYTFVWKTSGAWVGTCRRLVIKLDDGTTHTADFRFTG